VTEEQRRVAVELDREVRELVARGCDDLAIFGALTERGLPLFKWLIDTTTLDGLNALCTEFDGLRHCAELLESISRSMLPEPPDGLE